MTSRIMNPDAFVRRNYEPSTRILNLALKNDIPEQTLHDRLAAGMMPTLASTTPTTNMRSKEKKKGKRIKWGKR